MIRQIVNIVMLVPLYTLLLVYSVSTTELQTIVSDVVARMLREVSTSEILAEKERIAEEKRKLEEDRFVYRCSL